MNSADLVAQIRSAIEGLTRCGTFGIRPIMREAADRIEALEEWKVEAMEVLKQLAEEAKMSAAYWNGPDQPSFLRIESVARRFVEKEDGRAS